MAATWRKARSACPRRRTCSPHKEGRRFRPCADPLDSSARRSTPASPARPCTLPTHPLIRQCDPQRRPQAGLHRHRHRQAALRPRRQPLVRRPQTAQQGRVRVLPHQVARPHRRQVHLTAPKGQRHSGACRRAGGRAASQQLGQTRHATATKTTAAAAAPCAEQPAAGGHRGEKMKFFAFWQPRAHLAGRPPGCCPVHPGSRTRSRPPRAAAGRPGQTPGCGRGTGGQGTRGRRCWSGATGDDQRQRCKHQHAVERKRCALGGWGNCLAGLLTHRPCARAAPAAAPRRRG